MQGRLRLDLGGVVSAWNLGNVTDDPGMYPMDVHKRANGLADQIF